MEQMETIQREWQPCRWTPAAINWAAEIKLEPAFKKHKQVEATNITAGSGQNPPATSAK